MGLLSAVKDIFSTKKYESPVAKAANLALTAIAHPVGFITNTKKAYEQTAKESVGQLLVGGVSNALLAVAPFTGAVKTAATKTLAATIAKAPVKSAAVGLIAAGAAVSSPTVVKTAASAVAAAPETLFKTGETIGGVIEGTKNFSDLTTKDVKNLAVAAGAGVVLATTAAVVYDYAKDKIEAKEIKSENINPAQQAKGITVTDLSTIQTPSTPTMPQTAPISKTSGAKKRRKGVKKTNLPSINQNVRVNVINSSKSVGISHSKKYLNKQILA